MIWAKFRWWVAHWLLSNLKSRHSLDRYKRTQIALIQRKFGINVNNKPWAVKLFTPFFAPLCTCFRDNRLNGILASFLLLISKRFTRKIRFVPLAFVSSLTFLCRFLRWKLSMKWRWHCRFSFNFKLHTQHRLEHKTFVNYVEARMCGISSAYVKHFTSLPQPDQTNWKSIRRLHISDGKFSHNYVRRGSANAVDLICRSWNKNGTFWATTIKRLNMNRGSWRFVGVVRATIQLGFLLIFGWIALEHGSRHMRKQKSLSYAHIFHVIFGIHFINSLRVKKRCSFFFFFSLSLFSSLVLSLPHSHALFFATKTE